MNVNVTKLYGDILAAMELDPSLAKSELNKITSATRILTASSISSSHDGIEIMKNKTAERRYIPINKSFLLIFIILLLSYIIVLIT